MAYLDKIITVLAWGFVIATLLGAVYQIVALIAVRHLAIQNNPPPRSRPALTLLKPLCGGETDLYENLRSFCALPYPGMQIVFGVRDPNDPAIRVVEQLRADLPHADIALVVNENVYGANYKVSNLINMMGAAKHELLVMSDSDMHVDARYLDTIVSAMERPGVGLVTCLYLGDPTPGVWSALGAAGINFWFLPSAAASKLLGGKVGCYGATIALERRTLEAVGGFEAIKDQLADDYALGALVRDSGREIVVAPYFPATTADELNLGALFRHELRWARTIRNTAPIGYAASAITHPTPLAILALILGLVAGLPLPVLLITVACAIACRFALIARIVRVVSAPKPSWLLMFARDVLSLVIVVLAYCGRSISWRESAFRVNSVGALFKETDGI
jgi:ceramide glucosyltransferase